VREIALGFMDVRAGDSRSTSSVVLTEVPVQSALIGWHDAFDREATTTVAQTCTITPRAPRR
jgi:hypothetical protein